MIFCLYFFLIILLSYTIFLNYSTFTSFQIQHLKNFKENLYYNYERKGLPSRFRVIILEIL